MRDTWWLELREEMKQHASAMNCNTIMGYSEHAEVHGDMLVMSAIGTAIVTEKKARQKFKHLKPQLSK